MQCGIPELVAATHVSLKLKWDAPQHRWPYPTPPDPIPTQMVRIPNPIPILYTYILWNGNMVNNQDQGRTARQEKDKVICADLCVTRPAALKGIVHRDCV